MIIVYNYLIKFIRDFMDLFFFKALLNGLLQEAILNTSYSTNINTISIMLFEIILAIYCGAITSMLYHVYRELPKSITISYSNINKSMIVSFMFWLSFKILGFIGWGIVLKFLAIVTVEYFSVLLIVTFVTTIYNKLAYS